MIPSEVQLIHNLLNDYEELKKFLLENNQITFEFFQTEIFRKYLLISCASLFENQIQLIIVELSEKHSDSKTIVSLIKAKAIERQYHTYFDWKNKSANSFYKLFGNDFAEKMKTKIKSDENIKEAEKAFLELGSERNLLVHENFLNYPLNKTVAEISELFTKATRYIEFIREELLC